MNYPITNQYEQLNLDIVKRLDKLEKIEEESVKGDSVYFKYAIWSVTCMASTAGCVAALVLIVMEISKNINPTTST